MFATLGHKKLICEELIYFNEEKGQCSGEASISIGHFQWVGGSFCLSLWVAGRSNS